MTDPWSDGDGGAGSPPAESPASPVTSESSLHRWRRAALHLGLTVLAVVAGVAVGALAAKGRPGRAAIAVPTAQTVGRTVALDPYFHGKLTALLLPAPASSTKAAGIGSPDGTVSLDQAAKVYVGNNSTGYLKGLGFVQGASAAWLDSSGVLTQIDLYQFGSEALAFEWLADQRGFWRLTRPSAPAATCPRSPTAATTSN